MIGLICAIIVLSVCGITSVYLFIECCREGFWVGMLMSVALMALLVGFVGACIQQGKQHYKENKP